MSPTYPVVEDIVVAELCLIYIFLTYAPVVPLVGYVRGAPLLILILASTVT